MQDLQEVTHDLHYENFRAQRLKGKDVVQTDDQYVDRYIFVIVKLEQK